jgi:cytoskeletal protein CcmA (bactofilin family)
MNMPDRFYAYFLILVSLLTLSPATSQAQQFGEVVIKHGELEDDQYLAGAQVDLYATVNGDVVVAGGQLNLEGDINADLLAAGGTVTVRGVIADDARLAGGDLRILGKIGDDLVAAGGRIHIGRIARVGGRAWLSGGEIRVDGHVVEELRAGGGRVVISGKVDGNVELWAEHIVIEETAEINGHLHYKSPREAEIASGVRIDGDVVHTPVDVDIKPVIAVTLFAFLLLLFSTIVTAVVLYLLFPDFSLRAAQSLRNEPWPCLGVGLAVLAATPVLIVILFSTFIGVWLALLLLVIYIVTLITGYFIGALSLANMVLDKFGRTEISHVLRASILALTLLVLAVINLVPLLGGLIIFIVLIAGIGALSRQWYFLYKV